MEKELNNYISTNWLFNAIDEDLPLLNERFIIDCHRDIDNGTFPTVSSWKRFCKRVDNEGDEAIFKFMSKNRKVAKFNGFKIKKTDDNYYIIILDNPIKVQFGKVGDNPIIEEVKMIIGELEYEVYNRIDGAQDEYCNEIEILFEPKKFM